LFFHAGDLFQRFYFAWRFQILGPPPGFCEFYLVVRCPFHGKTSRSGWEVSFNTARLSIPIRACAPPYNAWKWGGPWSAKYILMVMP
jgi:hypothetical protein